MPHTQYVKRKFATVVNVSKIVTVHYYELDKDFSFAGETHDFWEMVYADKGEIAITAGKTKHVLKSGEIIFHRPGEFHTLRANGVTAPNVLVVSFVCRTKTMDRLRGLHKALPKSLTVLLSGIIAESRKTFDLPLFNPDMRELELLPSPIFGGEQMIRTYLEQLLILLLREETAVFTSEAGFMDRLTAQIIALLEAHLYDTLSIGDICFATHYGKTYLCTMFKRSAGYSIMQYFMLLKIAEAKKLIREKEYNFTEIANKLAFSDAHAFSHTFKKIVGMTPTEYKNSVRIQ